MTTIAEHSATVLPFTDAALRIPQRRRHACGHRGIARGTTGRCPTTSIVLARFARESRRVHRPLLARRPAGRRGGLMLVVIVTDNGFAAEAIRRSFREHQRRPRRRLRRRPPAPAGPRSPKPARRRDRRRDDLVGQRGRPHLRGPPRGPRQRRSSRCRPSPTPPWLGDAVRAGADAAIAKTVQPTTLGLLVREIWAGTIHHAFTSRRPVAQQRDRAGTSRRASSRSSGSSRTAHPTA